MADAVDLDMDMEGGSSRRVRGRGGKESSAMDVEETRHGDFETLDGGVGSGPARSVEGWIVFVRGVHEEAQDEDIHDKFADFGEIKNLHLNLDRKSGFAKGYAMVEYGSKKEADAAIQAMNGAEMLGQALEVNYAFVKGKNEGRRGGRRRD